MICKTTEETASSRRFRSCLKPHLKSSDHRTMRISKKSRPSTPHHCSLLPSSDINYIFNHQAMLAVSHAIEDLALDTSAGELIATFQHFDNFQYQENRYNTLAKKLDAVRVWGEGEPPKNSPLIDFIPIFHPELTRYWVVLFDSPDTHALLYCKQANQTTDPRRKVFSGFYSFNPFLVRCIRRRFGLLSCGIAGVVSHFERYFSPQMHNSLNDFDSLLAPS